MILPETKFLKIEKILAIENIVEIYMNSVRSYANCPECKLPSYRKHSNYKRNPKDIPWANIPVKLHLNVRRFFCDNNKCHYKIFTERIPDVVLPYSRITNRLNDLLKVVAFTNGGEEGRKIAKSIGIQISPDTLIRLIRRTPEIRINPYSVIGVDDWAIRKGVNYGTIIISHETGEVIDLLPDRKTETLESWIKAHPEINCVTRDRSKTYKNAIDNVSANIVQVADRWHLLKNLSDSIHLMLVRKNHILLETAKLLSPDKTIDKPLSNMDINKVVSKFERKQILGRKKKLIKFNRVKELFSKGWSKLAIAQEVGLDYKTVMKYISLEELTGKFTPSKLDKYKSYLENRWKEGIHCCKELLQEICSKGFKGSYTTVKNYLKVRKRINENYVPEKAAIQSYIKSPRKVAFLILSDTKKLKNEDKKFRKKLFEISPEIEGMSKVSCEFKQILKEQEIEKFEDCVEKMKNSGKELRSFAEGLKTDWDAVKAAASLKLSNGRTEGNVNRLKLIKRKMYGRANFDLLRLRVLYS